VATDNYCALPYHRFRFLHQISNWEIFSKCLSLRSHSFFFKLVILRHVFPLLFGPLYFNVGILSYLHPSPLSHVFLMKFLGCLAAQTWDCRSWVLGVCVRVLEKWRMILLAVRSSSCWAKALGIFFWVPASPLFCFTNFFLLLHSFHSHQLPLVLWHAWRIVVSFEN